MHESSGQHMIAVVRKCGGFVIRGIVTAQEFINKVFDEFAATERFYPELVPDLWAAVPETIRSEFAFAVRNAAQPDFRYHAFFIGGGQPMSGDADLRTARVQVWARAFLRFWDGVKASPPNRAPS